MFCNMAPTDILQHILDFTDIQTGLNIIVLCKETNKKLKIKYVYESFKLTDDILKQKKYSHLIALNAAANSKITNINNFHKLETLNASRISCGIDQKGIIKLNLKELNALIILKLLM